MFCCAGGHYGDNQYGRLQSQVGSGVFVPHHAAQQIRLGRVDRFDASRSHYSSHGAAANIPAALPADQSSAQRQHPTRLRGIRNIILDTIRPRNRLVVQFN